MGKYQKEIVAWVVGPGLHIHDRHDGTYGLTDKANATKFSSGRAVKAAIKWCSKHLNSGLYRHADLRKAGKETTNGNGI